MLPKNIAFIDIETTGTRIKYDRIIEIAIIRVENNKITKTFRSLVNPCIFVSNYIENLTGISKYELSKGPTFREISQDIQNILKDCVLAAHNARFDYGFLKSEYARLEKTFFQKHLCTVKLSKILFPEKKSHNLDSIIKRFHISCKNRHRAYDDAKVLYDFYRIIQDRFDSDTVSKTINHVLKKPSKPINIPEKELENLPEKPGVYIFYAKEETPLYIGKSKNIKERVLSHFSNDYSSSKEMSICQQVERIETIKTCGELGALFMEANLIKKLQPIYNRKLRRRKNLIVIKRIIDKEGYFSVFIDTVKKIGVSELDTIIGVFKSVKQAKECLVKISKEYKLCDKILGLEKTSKACFSYHLGYCKGSCIKKENVVSYNMRFTLAFSNEKIKQWPFGGAIIVEEKDNFHTTEAFIIDKWCVLGKMDISDYNQDECFYQKNYFFDYDIYKILVFYLKKNKKVNIKRIDLSVIGCLLRQAQNI